MSEGREQELPPRSDPGFWEEVLGGHGHAGWLLSDPEIDAAIRQERLDDLYRLFRKRRAAAPSTGAREALDGVLSNRRLFLQEVKGGPGLGSLNGIGARVYGSQEANPEDGTYITTQFFTILFLPLWPIAQFLVARAQEGGWFFFGRVPLAPAYRWWRRIVLVGAGSALVAIVTSAWHASTHADVHFLNGLPVPVAVTIGSESVRIDPGGRQTREIGTGRHHLKAALDDGRVVEELDVDVPASRDLVAYSVLGAAPLVLETVPYTAEGVDPSRGDSYAQARSLGSESWIVRDTVDVLFEPAPSRIRMEEGETVVTRRRVALYDGDWHATVMHLSSEQRAADVAQLTRSIARLWPEDEYPLSLFVHFSRQAGELEEARSFLEEQLASQPEAINVHRMYQEVMESLGRKDEVLERYRVAWKESPDSARAGYLFGRVAPWDEAVPVYESLLREHPDDPWLLRGLGWIRHQQGQFEDALPRTQRLMELQPDEAGRFVVMLAHELVAAGRVEEALAAVGRVLEAVPGRQARGEDPLAGGEAWALMGLYARLRLLLPDPAGTPTVAERWRSLLGDEAPTAELLAETAALARDAEGCDLGALQGDSASFCELVLLARVDPARAAEQARTAQPATLQRLPDEVQLAIAAELERQGHGGRAEKLLEGLSPLAAGEVGIDDLRALPDVDGLSEDLETVPCAALLVAAARRVEDPSHRAALLAQARHLDVLGLVTPD